MSICRGGPLRSVLAVGLLLFCAIGIRVAAARPAGPETASAEQRQILMMLHLPPRHFRPGSGYGGYYGDQFGARMRRALAARIARENGLALVGEGWPMPTLGIDCYVMQVLEDQDVQTVIDRLSKDRRVDWSQPMQVFSTQGRPSAGGPDPLFAAEPAAALWQLASLHRIATGKGSTVAVIDSKVDAKHPDLAGQLVVDMDFVANRPIPAEVHGTGVAAIIAAKANNGVGIAGIAPGARIMALRACWQTDRTDAAPTLCNSLGLARALDFAIGRSASVINMSLSGPNDRLLAKLIALARARGIAVVAAYDPSAPNGGFPASVPGVIAVTDHCPLAFPPSKIYCAPGDKIPTAHPGGKWFLVNGSSYAAANVSGLIALAREKQPSKSDVVLVSYRPRGGALDACATLFGAPRPGLCGATARQP